MNRIDRRPSRSEIIRAGAGDIDFLSLAKKMSAGSERFLLVSGGEKMDGRYSLAAWDPFLLFQSKGKKIRLRSNEQENVFEGDPLECLDELLDAFRTDLPLVVPPFSGGAIGYFAYELKNQLENIPQSAVDDLELPDIWLIFPRRILIHDRREETIRSIELFENRGRKEESFGPCFR